MYLKQSQTVHKLRSIDEHKHHNKRSENERSLDSNKEAIDPESTRWQTASLNIDLFNKKKYIHTYIQQ